MSKKIIYIVSTDKYGEAQFVFDGKFNVLDGWQRNDASYSNEYMSGFLEKLGIEVKTSLPERVDRDKLLFKAARKIWGMEDEG